MTALQQTAKKAQRRLWFIRWLNLLGWCTAAASCGLLLFVLTDRLVLWLPRAGFWTSVTAAGLFGLAVIASLIWLAATREGLIYAAAKLDEAAKLRERLSTGLHCSQIDEPFAHAVVQDADRLAAGIHVSAHLPVRLPRSAPWAGGTLLTAAIIALMLPNVDLRGKTQSASRRRPRTRPPPASRFGSNRWSRRNWNSSARRIQPWPPPWLRPSRWPWPSPIPLTRSAKRR